jgi:hypothetical protein
MALAHAAKGGYTGEPGAELMTGVGVRAGHRYVAGRGGLYLAPWIGLGYGISRGDTQRGDDRFEASPFTIFPTIHVGWRF